MCIRAWIAKKLSFKIYKMRYCKYGSEEYTRVSEIVSSNRCRENNEGLVQSESKKLRSYLLFNCIRVRSV